MPTSAIFFDDDAPLLSPLTDTRASFDVRTGAFTTLGRLKRALDLAPVALFVPPRLRAVTNQAYALPVNDIPEGALGQLLLVNGRCPLPLSQITDLPPATRLVEKASGDTIAAMTDAAGARRLLSGDTTGLEARELDAAVLLRRPWNVKTSRDAALSVDLALLTTQPGKPLGPGTFQIGGHPVVIDPSATIYPGTVFNAEGGPIYVGPGVVVRPLAILTGPCVVMEHSTILEQAHIKPGTAIGPSCKVAGEVAGTIFQGFANKSHDGHLGDSWIGEWVNLGAGTTNSNLLNTYTPVVAQALPGGPRERTGEVFLGAIIGDHVKAAIGTRLMTGCVLHVGSMFAQTAPVSGTVGPFTWATDRGMQPFRFEKFLDIARTVMARRNVTPSDAYVRLLAELHAEAVG
jgi:UDP-N-acetylglucosamine diphosphorylase/glucosamine-1-phosphate N-acetyltransferase